MMKNKNFIFEYDRKIEIDDMPANVSQLKQSAENVSDYVKTVIYINSTYKHIFLMPDLGEDYYDEYLMTASCSNKMQIHQNNQAKKLSVISNGENFIEVGCGDGSFLTHASKYFTSVIGIEPSKVFAREAKSKGFKIITGYVKKDTGISQKKYDAFASRQVFEHLENPLDVLIGISNNLKEGAVGLIEVPNGLRSFIESRYYDFFPDHSQYYSVASLVKLATDAGFIVLSCNTSFNDDYLELWLKYEPDFDKFGEQLIAIRKKTALEINKRFEKWFESNKKVAIWGVGAKTLSIMPLIDRDNKKKIVFAIDSDPHKHGKYIPNTSICVCDPKFLNKEPVDIVFVLALSYREEIKEQILSIVKKDIEIWTIDNNANITKI
jgi:SAM-dependent methyltransferase